MSQSCLGACVGQKDILVCLRVRCVCVYARMHVELIFCSVHTYVCWEGRGARTVQSLKKISPTLVYFEIYSSCGDGGASFVFHTKLVIIV